MKKVLPLVLAVLVVALATALAVQSQRGRAVINAVNADLAKERSRISELEAELTRLRSAQETYRAESEALRARLAAQPAIEETAEGEPSAEVAAANEGNAEAKPTANPMSQFAKMFKDPEMKKVMRTQQSMGVRMMYGELAAELGLSPGDADALNELLTDRQLAMSEQGMELMSGGADEKKMKEVSDASQMSRQEYDKQIADMLGQDGLKKFLDYERSMGERVMLRQFQDQFASRGTPLQEDQRKQLLSIMTEERTKAPRSTFDPASADVGAQMKAMQSEDVMEQQFEQQREINSRVLTRASEILGPEQVNSLRTSQEQMLEMQKMGLKMSRQMFQQRGPETK